MPFILPFPNDHSVNPKPRFAKRTGNANYILTGILEIYGNRITRNYSTEDLVEDHPGGPRVSWRTSGQWPQAMEPGVASDLHCDVPGPPCMERDRARCRQRIGSRPIPTPMIAASVTVSVKSPNENQRLGS